MGRSSNARTSRVALLATLVLFMTLIGQSYGQLRLGFYLGKCKRSNTFFNVERVVFDVVSAAFAKDRTIVAALLRMQFHDCFVRGCDASILLDGDDTEKTSGANGSVRGFDLIDDIKERLENLCPGVVSCADIIVIATRVAVNLAGGNWYRVEVGRRDGVVSRASEADASLPGPNIPIPTAVDLFQSLNLNVVDMVQLIGGGHTVGVFHCPFFIDRLYDFQSTGRSDPTMNPSTLRSLRNTCPRSGSNNQVFADQSSSRSAFRVDKGFFQAIRQSKGVLEVDQRMASDPLTRDIVKRLSMTGDFFFTFGRSMVKMGRVGVLTGRQGQIRRNCRRTN